MSNFLKFSSSLQNHLYPNTDTIQARIDSPLFRKSWKKCGTCKNQEELKRVNTFYPEQKEQLWREGTAQTTMKQLLGDIGEMVRNVVEIAAYKKEVVEKGSFMDWGWVWAKRQQVKQNIWRKLPAILRTFIVVKTVKPCNEHCRHLTMEHLREHQVDLRSIEVSMRQYAGQDKQGRRRIKREIRKAIKGMKEVQQGVRK